MFGGLQQTIKQVQKHNEGAMTVYDGTRRKILPALCVEECRKAPAGSPAGFGVGNDLVIPGSKSVWD